MEREGRKRKKKKKKSGRRRKEGRKDGKRSRRTSTSTTESLRPSGPLCVSASVVSRDRLHTVHSQGAGSSGDIAV